MSQAKSPQRAREVKKCLQKFADKRRAKHSRSFFKTGKGEYGEGDKFIGVRVPEQRRVAKKFSLLSRQELGKLLASPVHEHRLTAVFILVNQFKKAPESQKGKIYSFYLKNIKRINNWDLVDSSAPHIVGNFLLKKDKSILRKMALSKNLWTRRVAIVATFAFIRQGNFAPTFSLAQQLLGDEHDLVHKAVGWMLREVGKRDHQAQEKFLKKHYRQMPRTMLRYGIERFPKKLRKLYLKGDI